jgi:type IV pilus assembly protein PilB
MNKNLGLILKEMGFINDKDLEEGLNFQKKEKIRLGEALVCLGKITKSQLDYVISKQIDLPFVIVNKDQVDFDLLKRFSLEFMKSHKALPLFVDDDTISVVTDDPFNDEILNYFTKLSGKKVILSVASEENILDILNSVGDESSFGEVNLIGLNFKDRVRYDFILSNNRLEIYEVSGEITKIFEDKFYFDMFRVREILKGVKEFFYEESVGKNGVFMQLFFIDLAEGVYFSNLNYEGSKLVFKSLEPVFGYPYVSNAKKDYETVILLG